MNAIYYKPKGAPDNKIVVIETRKVSDLQPAATAMFEHGADKLVAETDTGQVFVLVADPDCEKRYQVADWPTNQKEQ